MDIAISNLTPNQQYILHWVYKEGTSRKTWKDIVQDLNSHRQMVQDDRRAAIEKNGEGIKDYGRIIHLCHG